MSPRWRETKWKKYQAGIDSTSGHKKGKVSNFYKTIITMASWIFDRTGSVLLMFNFSDFLFCFNFVIFLYAYQLKVHHLEHMRKYLGATVVSSRGVIILRGGMIVTPMYNCKLCALADITFMIITFISFSIWQYNIWVETLS